MLDDAHAARRRQQARARRQVEAARAVAAGADRIDRRRPLGDLRVHGQLAHRPRKTAHLVGRLAFGTQAGEKRAGERGVEFAGREPVHEFVGVVLGERLTAQQPVQQRAQVRFAVHDDVIRMKLAIRRSPSGVSTLSG